MYTPRAICSPSSRAFFARPSPPPSNHDGGNTSSTMPNDCDTVPSRAVAARNVLRQADPAFSIDAVSSTGLHYSWTWNMTGACRLHFVHLNLFPGHACGSPENPGHEGPAPGFSCGGGGWMGPEDSLGFLEADLAAHATQPGTHVVSGPPRPMLPPRRAQRKKTPPNSCSCPSPPTHPTTHTHAQITLQHYGYDGWSNTWYNEDQRLEMWATLLKYKTLAVLVGHTHGASVYSFNGTVQGAFGSSAAGFIDVINAPATQKEDGPHNPLPSEFMALEASVDASGAGTFRVAQRVGSTWGSVVGKKAFSC